MAFRLIQSLKKPRDYFGRKIELLSPAKLNLYLNIVGKYPSGFHRIESVVERISLCDTVAIEIKKDPRIKIFCNDKTLEGEHNLCFKAIALIKRKLKIPYGFHVFLTKKIPMGSGLGGGSSNAAVTLLGIDTLFNLKLTQTDLYRWGSQLGSDVNFFLAQSRFAFMQGKGEKIIPFEGKTFHHQVVWPGIHLSTKDVYKNARVKLTKFLGNAKIVAYSLKKGDSFLLKNTVFNALEKSAFTLCPELQQVKDCLAHQGVFSKLTGSGSALYTISDNSMTGSFDLSLPGEWLKYDVQTF